MSIPKFVACPTFEAEEENIYYYGTGDTPDLALEDFRSNGRLKELLNDSGCMDELEVAIWTACSPSESDWPVEAIDPTWPWCLEERLETRVLNTEDDD